MHLKPKNCLSSNSIVKWCQKEGPRLFSLIFCKIDLCRPYSLINLHLGKQVAEIKSSGAQNRDGATLLTPDSYVKGYKIEGPKSKSGIVFVDFLQ